MREFGGKRTDERTQPAGQPGLGGRVGGGWSPTYPSGLSGGVSGAALAHCLPDSNPPESNNIQVPKTSTAGRFDGPFWFANGPRCCSTDKAGSGPKTIDLPLAEISIGPGLRYFPSEVLVAVIEEYWQYCAVIRSPLRETLMTSK